MLRGLHQQIGQEQKGKCRRCVDEGVVQGFQKNFKCHSATSEKLILIYYTMPKYQIASGISAKFRIRRDTGPAPCPPPGGGFFRQVRICTKTHLFSCVFCVLLFAQLQDIVYIMENFKKIKEI